MSGTQLPTDMDDDVGANPGGVNAGNAAPRQGFARGAAANARGNGAAFLAGRGGRGAAPVQPAAAVVLPQRPAQQPSQATRDAWSAEFFRRRGWESKKAQQTTLKSELDMMVKTAADPNGPNGSKALAAEKLKPSPNFDAYLSSLAACERAGPTRDPALTADLRARAEAVKARYEAVSGPAQKDKGNKRKYQVCLDTLARLDMEPTLAQLGDPPWDSKQAMTAASLKAQADFASLPIGEQGAEELKGGGVNSAFWVNTAGDNPAKPQKSFLFKPATNKQDRLGIPPGGEPAREALTGRAADILNGMTGIAFNVPETHIVSVPRGKFDTESLGVDVIGDTGTAPLTGSLQQFSKTDGELREQSPLKAAAVPPERCQELAILDIVTLSLDRHGGNFLMTGDNKKADLVPIDNGLSFPSTTEEFGRISSSHNALLGVPGAHKPFSAQMLQNIAKLDAGAMAKALKSEVDTIESVHASAQGKVDDAAIEMSRRSTMFLKIAAPTLSPAAVQVAMGQNATALFDPTIDDAEFQRRAAQAVAAMAADQATLADFFLMSRDEKAKAQGDVETAGWDPKLAANPQLVLALFKQGTPPPPNTKPALVDPATITPTEVSAMTKVYATAKSPADIPAWRQFMQAGGTDALTAVLDRTIVDGQERALYLRKNVGEAANLLAQFAAATVIKATADQVAGNTALLDAKYDLVVKMAGLMDASIQQPIVSREALTARNSGDALELNKVRDLAVTLLQQQIFGELEKVEQAVARVAGVDKANAKALLDKIKQRAQAGDVIAAMENLIKRKAIWNIS